MSLRVCLLWLMCMLTARAVVEGEADTFAPVLNGAVMAMLPTSDGGVIICGSFTEVNGTPRGRIAKLLSDGSLDPNFATGTGADGTIHCIVPATSGYFIGGDFLNYRGQARSRIAQITSTGALNTTFNPGAGANATVRCLSTASVSSSSPTSSVLVGGDFTQLRGVDCKYFAQLSNLGQFTNDFAPNGNPMPSLQPNATVRSFGVTHQGIFIGGDFTAWGSKDTAYFAKVSPNMAGFIAFPGFFDGPVTALIPRTEGYSAPTSSPGSLICMGSFTLCSGQPRLGFAHLLTGPTYYSQPVALLRETQMSLTGGVGRCGIYPGDTSYSYGMIQTKAYLGGEFTTFNDYPAHGIAGLDASFSSSYDGEEFLSPRSVLPQEILPAPKVFAMAQMTGQDRLYVAGDFSSIGGKTRSGIARLYGASLDALPDAPVELRASPLDDTRMMLCWDLSSRATSYQLQRTPAGSDSWTTIAEISPRYYLDTGLTPGTEYSYRLIARNFSGQTAGTQVVNATTDATPWTGSGATASGQTLPAVSRTSVSDCDFYPDGRVVVVGNYSPVSGKLHDSISVLMPDGSLDPSFTPAENFSGNYYAVKVQPDGKILVAGSFSSIGGVVRNNLARLNADGSLDTSFTPTLLNGNSVSFSIYDVDLLPDGRVLAVGGFDKVDGYSQDSIALLLPDGRRDTTFHPGDGISLSSQLRVLPDGRFFVSGTYSYNGSTRSPFLLLPNGSLDARFPQALALADITADAVDVDATGRIYLGGSFTVDATGGPRNLARVLPDGTWDPTFAPPTFLSSSFFTEAVRDVRVMKDGKVLVFGDFVRCGNVITGGIVRLMPDGSLDPTFRATGAVPYRFPDGGWYWPEAVEIDPANRVWIIGLNESSTGLTTPGLICLDTVVDPPGAPSSTISASSRNGGVLLEWTPGANAYATRIEGRLAGTTTWTVLAELPVPISTWWHQAPSPGSTWEYRLSAVNKTAASEPGGNFPGSAYDSGRLWAAAAGVADLSDMEADGDHDGIPLSLEYAFGGNPDGSGDPQPEAWTLFGRLFLSYPRLRPDLNYVVEQSQDGIGWTSTGVHQGPAGTSAFASVPMDGESRTFLRVNVVPK